jgi:hypothetical protein
MLIDVTVLDHNDTWTEIHISKTFEDYTMPTTLLQSKYPAPIQAGQKLGSFDTQWLKHALTGPDDTPYTEKDEAQGYGEVW